MAAALLVAGCGAGLGPEGRGPFDDRGMHNQLMPQAMAAVQDRTFVHFNTAHGTQIEYLAADGRTWLWYPGNRRAVAGQWRFEPVMDRFAGDICFTYGPNSSNPVTGERGGDEECNSTLRWTEDLRDVFAGDPFGLSQGSVPGVLPPQARLDAAQLAALSGRPVSALRPAPFSRRP